MPGLPVTGSLICACQRPGSGIMVAMPDSKPAPTPERTATRISLAAEVTPDMAGKRLDQIAAQLFPDYSRARLQSWIRNGELRVDNRQLRPRDKVYPGAVLRVEAALEVAADWDAESLPLDIVYDDDCVLVLNKAAGTVVHPAAGNHSGTLLNGLLHRYPQLQELPRAGIVHRLDKDTTGLMVVAKTLPSHTHLVARLQARDISREYEAVVHGVLTGGGSVNEPLGRHPVNRKKRAVIFSGKPAVSHFRVIERFRAHTHVQVKLETGRTHQIRVHMAHIGHSLVGDPLYGGRLQIPAGSCAEFSDCLRRFRRQALHAKRLAFDHPLSGEAMSFEAPLPADLENLLAQMRSDAGQRL